MYKVVATFLMIFMMLSSTRAATNTELIDAIDDLVEQKQTQQLTTTQDELAFDSFSSCEDMTSTLEDFVQDNFSDNRYGRGGGGPIFFDDMAVEEMAMADTDTVSAPRTAKMQAGGDDSAENTIGSSTTDVSTTNLQVDGVDEADIIKTDGDYIYYYNDHLKTITILQSPLDRDTATIRLADATIVSEIKVPKTFWGTQLYVQDGQLILLAQRWSQQNQQSWLDRNGRTNVVIYDITNISDPKLMKLSDFDGSYHDSRRIGDTLYVVSQLNVNRRRPQQYRETAEEVVIDAVDVLPKTIDIAYTRDTDDQNLTIGTTTFPYHVSVSRPDCNEVNYVLPSKESMEEFTIHPSFTVVRAIDLRDTTQEPTTTASFGSTQTIHMSQQGLYLVSPFYAQRAFTCPANARCILPWYHEGQHTLIHKFGLEKTQMIYEDSNLVSGSPLSQYSMSEDSHGFFRILTSTWHPERATHLFVLDDDMELQGLLMNIEPGEEFKSSRFIGDKLYLVTFEQIDPLFVIDIENTKKPKIIGELKIPGFSTYLHPYAPAADGKQYLLGLGYDTVQNQWGGTQTSGVKLDLYEIDYTDIDSNGQVAVRQKHTKTRGEKNSFTEAAQNPRMFVRDEKRELLVLPMILSSAASNQRCEVEMDAAGNEVFRECRDDEHIDTSFAGLKAMKVDIDSGIQETASYNYLPLLKDHELVHTNRDGGLYPRQFQQFNFRVGFAGDVLYTLNSAFAHFGLIDSDDEWWVNFDD